MILTRVPVCVLVVLRLFVVTGLCRGLNVPDLTELRVKRWQICALLIRVMFKK